MGLTTTFLKESAKQNAKSSDDFDNNGNAENGEAGKSVKQAGEATISEHINANADGNK